MISVCFQGKPFNITVIQVYGLTSNAEEVERFNEDLQVLLELKPKNDVLFIMGKWNGKGDNQEIPGVTGKFGLGVQNEVGERLIEFCQENSLVIANTIFHSKHPLPTTQEKTTYRHHQMVNTENQIIFFAAKDGEALYSQQKQDQELTVAQIMNFLSKFSNPYIRQTRP